MATYITSVNNLSNLPNLGALNLIANQITAIDLTSNDNLQEIRLSDNNLETLDLGNITNCSLLNIQSNPNLATLNLPGLNLCGYVSTFNCSLPTSTISAILIDLADNGSSGGNCFLDGGSNGVPTLAGINAANTLTGRSWTVTYNT
jgi:hypothetical protein